jgi:hypothetical protein
LSGQVDKSIFSQFDRLKHHNDKHNFELRMFLRQIFNRAVSIRPEEDEGGGVETPKSPKQTPKFGFGTDLKMTVFATTTVFLLFCSGRTQFQILGLLKNAWSTLAHFSALYVQRVCGKRAIKTSHYTTHLSNY